MLEKIHVGWLVEQGARVDGLVEAVALLVKQGNIDNSVSLVSGPDECDANSCGVLLCYGQDDDTGDVTATLVVPDIAARDFKVPAGEYDFYVVGLPDAGRVKEVSYRALANGVPGIGHFPPWGSFRDKLVLNYLWAVNNEIVPVHGLDGVADYVRGTRYEDDNVVFQVSPTDTLDVTEMGLLYWINNPDLVHEEEPYMLLVVPRLAAAMFGVPAGEYRISLD
jgi:hypothetical protein